VIPLFVCDGDACYHLTAPHQKDIAGVGGGHCRVRDEPPDHSFYPGRDQGGPVDELAETTSHCLPGGSHPPGDQQVKREREREREGCESYPRSLFEKRRCARTMALVTAPM